MASSNSITDEEDNCIRFFKLVRGPGTEAVRIFFDSYFPNNTLNSVLQREENNIRQRARQWRITQKQLDLIFPAVGTATSKKFDTTLLIALIRHFIQTIGHVVIPTNNYWESLPDPKDTAKGDDLARIKFYRNEIAHYENDTLDTTTFKIAWKTIKEAISRLSGSCLDQRCIQLETMRLDNINEVRKEIKSFKADLVEYVNELRIPGRDAQSLEIEMWEEENNKFVSTNAVDAIMNALQVEDCVTVVGSFGQGKSFLIQHVALRLRDEQGYEIIPCRDPMDIKLWYEKEKKQIIILDDLYGEGCLLRSKFESWQDHTTFLKMILRQGMVKIVASSRLHIFKDANSKFENDVFQYVLDLKTKPLTNLQKQEMLIMHIHSIEELEINSILEIADADLEEHFPLVCLMYNSYRKGSILSNTLNFNDFFCNIRRIHEDFLNNLKKDDENSYKTILIFVLLDGVVSQKEYSNEVRFLSKEVKLSALLENLAIVKDTFYKCLENLTGTFFKKSMDMFLPIHNTMFLTLLEFSARVSQNIVINHLNSSLLFGLSKFTAIDQNASDLPILIRPENEILFFKRMIDELTKRKIFKVFDQYNMNNKKFRLKFIEFIRIESLKDDQLVRRILNTKDEAKIEGTLPMLPIQIASHRGWADMVEMLASYVDVNFYGIVGFSALHAACVVGDIDTIRVLISNNADVNKTANWGQVVSAFNRTITRQLCSPAKLLQEIGQNAEISPLLIACAHKHKFVVKLLLENGASLTAYKPDKDSLPSFLQHFSDTSVTSPGFFLLGIAFRNRDSEMYKILLDNGAKLRIIVKCQEIDIPLD